MPRSSKRNLFLSDGSTTTKRDLSYLKCRSMSGSVPRPMEPKPIITIGPVMVACIGQLAMIEASFVARRNRIAVKRNAEIQPATKMPTSRGMAHPGGQQFPPDSCGFLRRQRCDFTSRGDHSMRICKRARHKFEREQTIPLERAGHMQPRGERVREAEAAIIGFVADENDSAMTKRSCVRDRFLH